MSCFIKLRGSTVDVAETYLPHVLYTYQMLVLMAASCFINPLEELEFTVFHFYSKHPTVKNNTIIIVLKNSLTLPVQDSLLKSSFMVKLNIVHLFVHILHTLCVCTSWSTSLSSLNCFSLLLFRLRQRHRLCPARRLTGRSETRGNPV